jgi:predicted aconitase with swiveling domain
MTAVFQGRSICKGSAEGEALVAIQELSFLGGVDPETGIITEVDHDLYGEKMTGKIFVVPGLKGSTAGMWIIIRLAENKKGPKAIITRRADTILVGAVIMAGIPTIDSFSVDPLQTFKSGHWLKVDVTKGTVEIVE